MHGMKLDSSYLRTQTSRSEVELRIDFLSAPSRFREDWERLLSKMKRGDELWNFSPPDDRPATFQLWGVALARNGEVISTLLEALD